MILVGALLVAAHAIGRAFAQTAAPTVSDVAVTELTPTSSVITWTTNTKTDSDIDVSLDTNYCGIRNEEPPAKTHSITVLGLDPATTYFYRIRSTDADGNQQVSGDYTFTTSSTVDLSKITNPQQQQLAEKSIAAIQQITSPTALQTVAQALNAQAEKEIGPPEILGNPQIDIQTDQATVSWTTDQDADGEVFVASAAEYNSAASNPYAREEQDPNASTKTHTVTLYGLSPATQYHYKVASKGPIGSAGESGDLTFTTKSVLPQIINPHVVKVGEHEATISWGTPVPSAGTVTYTNMANRKALSTGDPSFLVTHILQLTNLTFQTRYSAVVTAENQAGDRVVSDPIYFVTTKNIFPPVISQVNNDSTLYPGQDTTVQTVVSWMTDVPATCYLSYIEGVVKKDAGSVTSSPESAPLTKHVSVITNFAPATVYKYWVTCTDVDGNTTSSEDFVLLTPEQQKSIVDIILDNFQGTFGWLNAAGGKKK